MDKIIFRILLFFLVGLINFSCTKSEIEESSTQVTQYMLSVKTNPVLSKKIFYRTLRY